MSNNRCVLLISHPVARLFDIDRPGEGPHQIRMHVHNTAQHGSAVRGEHEFHADICDALTPCGSVLVLGSRTALTDFRHYVDKHRPATMKKVSALEAVDYLTDHQLVAMGRIHFEKIARGDAPVAKSKKEIS